MIDARVDVDVRPVSRYTIDYSHCTVYPVRMGIRRLTALGVQSGAQTKTRLVGVGGGGEVKSHLKTSRLREECLDLCIIDWHEIL